MVTRVASEAVLARAGEVSIALAEYTTTTDPETGGGEAAVNAVLSSLGKGFLKPYLLVLTKPKAVASGFALAVGKLLGSKKFCEGAIAQLGDDAVANALTSYVQSISILLANVAADATEAEADETAKAADPAAAPSLVTSTIGYVPTVSTISSEMAIGSAGMQDEHLSQILAGIASFLSVDRNRVAFCTRNDDPAIKTGPAVLAALLEHDVSLPVQATYQTVFCLWLLSFTTDARADAAAIEADIAAESSKLGESATPSPVAVALEEAVVPRMLTQVLREATAEKIVRISLSTLRNIMELSTELRKEMVGAGLVATLESLTLRRWNDEDIREDIKVLAESLDEELASMSTFDVYRMEVLSGALEWTPAHRDDAFWRENVEKLDTNNRDVLRCLVRLLSGSSDSTVLAVACHDLAQFIKYHPQGRYIVQNLGAKPRLMELMSTGTAEVRRYALNTVQVLMISNWNIMQRTS